MAFLSSKYFFAVVHYGWFKLQGVDALVNKEERENLPFYKVSELDMID